MILKHKIMVNLKFDIGIACFFGYSIIFFIVFAQNWIIIIDEINNSNVIKKLNRRILKNNIQINCLYHLALLVKNSETW